MSELPLMLHAYTHLVTVSLALQKRTLQVPGTWMVTGLPQARFEGDSVEPKFRMRHFNTLTWP